MRFGLSCALETDQMVKPQVFEHAHFLLHHETRLPSELEPQTHLDVALGVGLMGEEEGVVVIHGEDGGLGSHLVVYVLGINILWVIKKPIILQESIKII
jgi:hypothetical protein